MALPVPDVAQQIAAARAELEQVIAVPLLHDGRCSHRLQDVASARERILELQTVSSLLFD